ncbi:MAG TPA: alpha/beta fold hydrolase [Candidatus Acidoferrum sp.]|jgi:pimeloyl-ACP methyl ester carboxylesterase|nr:alpha/beta fold hydrolase [Candidatus Acidoferrum sp.]
MKSRKLLRALVGVLLCAMGFWLALATPYHQQTILTDATSCRMTVDIIEPLGGVPQGSVVLLHGLSANKKIMFYFAQGFSERGLRVFIPDLPGHGRTAGPFSPARAETCTESFVRELMAVHLLAPDRTILAGHSMGGAIAVRIASRVPVAGVLAISPAPQRAAHGTKREMLLFDSPPPLHGNALVISGVWEPESMRGAGRDLAASGNEGKAEYLVIPRATHVSLLFDQEAMRASQEWAAELLHLKGGTRLPARWPLLGFFLGFGGLIVLTGPFLRELLGKNSVAEPILPIGTARLLLEVFACSVAAVLLLHRRNFLRPLHLFEGDYFAGFLLINGGLLVLLHQRAVQAVIRASPARPQVRKILTATFCAFVVLLLFNGWFDLTFSGAWLIAARWLRFPAFFLVCLPYHAAEEIVAGPPGSGGAVRHLALTLSLRLIAWCALLGGIFFLHSGEVLLMLLAPYFGLFCLLQGLSMDIVRRETGSSAAAAVFGAILMSGFCLAIFPIA